jgi:hypothetical protein
MSKSDGFELPMSSRSTAYFSFFPSVLSGGMETDLTH